VSSKNVAGAALCALILLAVFLAGEGRVHYLNAPGLLIVLAGTCGATLLSFPMSGLRAGIRVAWNVYRVQPVAPATVVGGLVDIALRSRSDGVLALEDLEDNTEVSFLKSALELLVDGYDEREIRESLGTEMSFFVQRRAEHERVFRHMAQLAPAFGVAGSVVGLIGMLTGLGDTRIILETIPLALTSTLYGVVLGSFVCSPIAESIRSKTQQELLLQRLILEGVVAVQQERKPDRLERRLLSFLTPAERPSHQRSFDEIHARYVRQRRDEVERSQWLPQGWRSLPPGPPA
jgi:chemotaxis protein MotA